MKMKNSMLAVVLFLLVAGFRVEAQDPASNVFFSSVHKEVLKSVEKSKSVYMQDKYAIKISLDVSQIPGFLDNISQSNAENISLRILFDRSIFNQYWMKNNGQGTFAQGSGIGDEDLNSYDDFIGMADFDGDGHLDGVAFNFDGQRVWLKNDGQGNFTDSGNIIGDAENDYSANVVFADFNGDGSVDAFVANDGPNKVYFNNGQGVFTDSGQELGDAPSNGLAVGYINPDTYPDVFVANETSKDYGGSNAVWINDGHGVFTQTEQTLGFGNSMNVALGDLNGDGYLDAIMCNSGPNQIFFGDGYGNFIAGESLGNAASEGIALADFNGDGHLDAVIGNNEYTTEEGTTLASKVWINNGDGTFSGGTELVDSSNKPLTGEAIAAADFNKDGKQDFFIVGSSACIFLGNGDGTFTLAQDSEDVYNSALNVSTGDINGDGFTDIFASLRVYEHEGEELLDFEDTLNYAEKGEDEEKYNLLKIKEGKSGIAKFVTAEDVSLGDKPKYKKTLSIIAKWNAKKLTITINGRPELDYDENILDLNDDLDELKEQVSATNKKVTRVITGNAKKTNCSVIFNNYYWDARTIYYTGKENAKYKSYKEEGSPYEEVLGDWNVKGDKTEMKYMGIIEEE